MFEMHLGWLPVDAKGWIWRYRERGSYGVLVINRDAEGKRSFEATHQDSSSNDETITTRSKRKAVRFVEEGKKK